VIFVIFCAGRDRVARRLQHLQVHQYIKEERLIVLGTSSPESMLPSMIEKMENLGCKQSVVGLVIPPG
jgi:aerobic C4-dicarboxylate transport protein